MVVSPYISVIVTAHDRKEFLPQSLKSVTEQTLDHSLFEVIVVKNFSDVTSDGSIAQLGARIFFSDTTIGEKLKIGINNANGEVLVFLEDDDLFCKSKLEHVYHSFRSSPDLIFYHNSSMTIDAGGKRAIKEYYNSPIYSERIRIPLDRRRDMGKIVKLSGFNQMSSIAVRSSSIKPFSNTIANLTVAADRGIFFISLQNGGDLIIDSEMLTMYRYHESLSNSFQSVPGTRISMERISRQKIEDYSRILQIVKGSSLGPLCEAGLNEARLEMFLSSKSPDGIRRAEVSHSGASLLVFSLRSHLKEELFLAAMASVSVLCRTLCSTLFIRYRYAKGHSIVKR